jgi:hypothetical protein
MLSQRRAMFAFLAASAASIAVWDGIAIGEAVTPPASAGDENCEGCEADRVRYFKLQVKEGTGRQSEPAFEWVESKEAPQLPVPAVADLRAAREAVVRVRCRTTPTNHQGRKSCNDEEVHTLPDGYVFVENNVRKEWHSDIGSSNSCSITWLDRVEVIPGTGITQARTMKVKGHARSGHGYGERGHTDVTVRCKFVKYTQ